MATIPLFLKKRDKKSHDATDLDSRKLNQEVNHLKAARVFAQDIDSLTKKATDFVIQTFHISSKHELDHIVERTNKILKYLTWSLAGEGISFLDQNFLPDFLECLKLLNHPHSWYVKALEYIRSNHNLTGESAEEMNSYIDHIIYSLK